MKILLLGKNGQIGWELQRSLSVLGDLVALERQSVPFGDLSNPDRLVDTVRNLCPDIIVNAAAYTSVDKAESEVDLARMVNATAPSVLAQVASDISAWLVHYSTDYVFDGTGILAWQEGDPTGPLGEYGKTKLEGEQAIIASGCNHLIFRTSWVYAARGKNFSKTILQMALEHDHLNVINDQIGAPTGADMIADVTAHAIRRVLKKPELSGLYHLVASGETSWHGYANHVITRARQLQPQLGWKVSEIVPVPSSFFLSKAKRPLNSRLSTQKIQQAFAITLPHWQIGVDRLVDEIK